MGSQLWKLFWDKDVDGFCRLLAPASSGTGSFTPGSLTDPLERSFGSHSLTPPKASRSKKAPGKAIVALSKAELNLRDHAGLTLLHRAAASDHVNAIKYVRALVDHPSIDLYAQDLENGWNALHRALYRGNIGIARLLLEKEQRNMRDDLLGRSVRVGRLIKTKDFEGHSPFDLYNSTITTRQLSQGAQVLNGFLGGLSNITTEGSHVAATDSDTDSDTASTDDANGAILETFGNEVFVFGSNKNHSLGVGDGDDRQFPERIQLQRPEKLFELFHQEWMENEVFYRLTKRPNAGIPQMIRSRPIRIRDVVLSKLHSAIITDDAFSNLYVSGVGRGGRLGLGHENTQFRFVTVQHSLEDKRVMTVALGQNHSMAVTDNGELWTWGSNTCSQLGYTLPAPVKPDEEPMSLTPRQVFNALKKEKVVGVAASALHSVAFTATSLYTWGRNAGQLALMDADSRSLQVQTLPRKVAASMFTSPIVMATASDKATVCLLKNHTVIVFTNYGYNIARFPAIDLLTGFGVQTSKAARSSRGNASTTKVISISSGSDTISALSGRGEIFIMTLQASADGETAAISTTNPSKIKSSVSVPQCVWHARKDEATSVGVGEDGSVIISTKSGAVWRRVRRDKAKEHNRKIVKATSGKRDAFKFQRVPTITGAVAVRGSMFGTYSVIRTELQIARNLVCVRPPELWLQYSQLFPLAHFKATTTITDKKFPWLDDSQMLLSDVGLFGDQIFRSFDIEGDVQAFFETQADSLKDIAYNVLLSTSQEPSIKIPAHTWILAARSVPLRNLFAAQTDRETDDLRPFVHFTHNDGQHMELVFQNLDFLALLNLVSFLYTDSIVQFWNYTRYVPYRAQRHRQVRVDLMKLASGLRMLPLEAAARSQNNLKPMLHLDLREAVSHRSLRHDGDVILKLDGKNVFVHHDVICQRCPFFKGLFQGDSKGAWLAKRREELEPGSPIVIELSHMNPRHFAFVLEHIYADVGPEMFDDVVTSDLDTFGELVLGVMTIANELMLDRLIESCQNVLSRFVNMQNVAGILNEADITYVTDLKQASLKYITLQMEGFLENHLLDNMNSVLIAELDDVVRQNQLCCQPFSRSGRLEDLYEVHPELIEDIAEERRVRVREMAWKAALRSEKTANKTRRESLDTMNTAISPFGKPRRKGKEPATQPEPKQTPDLGPEDDGMILDMEMEPLTPIPKNRDKAQTTEESSARRSSKKLALKREPLNLDGSLMTSRSQPPPAAPWSEFQPIQSQPISMVTENMAEATLDDDSEWQSVSTSKAKRAPAFSTSPFSPPSFISGSPSAERPARPIGGTPSQTPRRPSASTKPVTPSSSLPSRPLNLGSFISGATPPEPPKLKMTIPPPPTQPATKLSDIFSEQLQEKETEKEMEQYRSRPLQEIIEEEQFLQWWEEEQERMRTIEEEEKKSMRLVRELMAQQNARLSGDSSKSQSRNKGKGKGKAKALAVDLWAGSPSPTAVQRSSSKANTGSLSSVHQGDISSSSRNAGASGSGGKKGNNHRAKNRGHACASNSKENEKKKPEAGGSSGRKTSGQVQPAKNAVGINGVNGGRRGGNVGKGKTSEKLVQEQVAGQSSGNSRRVSKG